MDKRIFDQVLQVNITIGSTEPVSRSVQVVQRCGLPLRSCIASVGLGAQLIPGLLRTVEVYPQIGRQLLRPRIVTAVSKACLDPGNRISRQFVGRIDGTSWFGKKILPYFMEPKSFLARFDPAGDCSWVVTARGKLEESVKAVAVDLTGDAIVGGTHVPKAMAAGPDERSTGSHRAGTIFPGSTALDW